MTQQVTATEFARNFGRYREEAQREAVAVVTHNRVTGYFVSAHEYEELQRLKALAPTALAVEELSAATLRALTGSRMDARHDQLNLLMD
ncbi:MAG: type II toxin-antitoxin system Phd/YefM family antitoxin [Janthinobacterium lividum]